MDNWRSGYRLTYGHDNINALSGQGRDWRVWFGLVWYGMVDLELKE